MNIVQSMSSFIISFPWAKLAYSAALIAGAFLLLSEALRVWTDQQLYIGTFRYYDDGEETAGSGQSFGALILHQHRALVDQLRLEEERRAYTRSAPGEAATAGQIDESIWWPMSPAPVSDSKTALSDVELSVQGINFTQLFTALRRWVNPPNEVTGYVDKGPHGLRALVEWPNAPQRPNGGLAGSRVFPVQAAVDDATASFDVACGLIWIEIAARQDRLFGIPRLDFCAWVRAWVGYTGVRSRIEALHALSDQDRDTLIAARGIVDGLIQRRSPYPEVYRLRADIIDLLPKDVRQPDDSDDATALSDRIRYAIMTGQVPASAAELSERGDAAVEAAVLEQARPALRVEDGRIADEVPPAWTKLLRAASPVIERATASTGFLRGAQTGHPFTATAFVVSPGIVMTIGYVPEVLMGAPVRPGPVPKGQKIEFVIADLVNDPAAEAYEVTEFLYVPPLRLNEDLAWSAGYIALLRVKDLDPTKRPPLPLQREFTKNRQPLNQLVILTAYIPPGAMMDKLPRKELLGGVLGAKSILPGRLLRLKESPTKIDTITYDANTARGAAGAPVIDLLSGEVVGVHSSGELDPAGGKLAHAALLADVLAQPEVRRVLGLG